VRPTTTPALVLRLFDYGESDRIVVLLGQVTGKISALARGARASKRRFGAGLSLFAIGTATVVERRASELWRLDAFEAQGNPARLAEDIATYAHAAYAVELLRELVPPAQPHPSLYELGVRFLGGLARDGARPERLRSFELRLLEELGLAPALDHCAVCGEEAKDGPDQVFDIERGGVLCTRCRREGSRHLLPLPAAVRRALAHVQKTWPDEVDMPWLEGGEARLARDLMRRVLERHLGKPLKSLEFLEKANRGVVRTEGG